MVELSDAKCRLLAALFNDQLDPASGTPLSPERIRVALTKGPALTLDEQRQLLLSPTARADYLRLKRQLHAEIQARWHAQGLRPRLLAKAAAARDQVFRYDSEDGTFSVMLYRQPDVDMPWMVLLQLSTAVRETLYPMTPVRLVDSGGLEWVRGQIDAHGELSFGWHDPTSGPDQRLRRHSLDLELA